MADSIKISETTLLYDPLFDKKPDIVMKGGRNTRFKIVFIVMISFFVGISLFLSFSSLSGDKYEYKQSDNGWQLYQFNGEESDLILEADFVRDKKGVPDYSKPVTSVREFSITCNEYVQFIFVGKDVTSLENHCFYYVKNLMAVIVDPENPVYASVDGVLFNKDMSSIIFHPVNNYRYRCALGQGIPGVSSREDAEAFLKAYKDVYLKNYLDSDGKLADLDEVKSKEFEAQFSDYCYYEIPDGITEICDSCFSDCETLKRVTIPDGVKTIGTLAFFKCKALETLYIPDGVETIGSDGFSYCENLDYIFVPESVTSIGHHAFFGCLGPEGREIKEIYMGAQGPEGIQFGENWLPKQNKKTMKEVNVVYGQTRRDE